MNKPQPCVTCTQPVQDARLCQVCAGRFEYLLAEFAALDIELELTETRQTAMGPRNGSRSSETAVAFNPACAEVRADVHATLAGWVFELDPVADRDRSITVLSRWLLKHVEQVRQRDDADQIIDEIRYASRQGWKAVDRPKDRARVFVAACLDPACTGELWARIPTDDYDPADDTTHARIACTECEVTYRAERWLSLGRRIRAQAAA